VNPDTEDSGCGTGFFMPGNYQLLVKTCRLVKVPVMKDSIKPGGGVLSAHVFRPFCLAVLLAVGHLPQADAGSLFRWTDSEGRMHFGDRPPPAEVEHVEELNMPSFAAPSRPADQDPYSILNQLGRLEANRQILERERRERAWQEREYYLRQRELEALEQAADRPANGPVYGYPRPVYPSHPIHRPRQPGHRPGRPVQRAPSRIDRWYEPDLPAYRPGLHPRSGVPRPLGGASINLRR
jgi:hypothetical protein